MNDDDFLRQTAATSNTFETPIESEKEKELKEALPDQDKQQEVQGEQQTKAARSSNPFTSEFWLGKENATAEDYGFTSVNNPNDVRFTSDVEGINKDPRAAIEYYAAPAVGVADTGIGLFNLASPLPDVPQIPKFQDKGAQLVRDVSSILIPVAGTGGLVNKGAGLIQKAGGTGRAGAFLRDPLVKYLGTNSAKIGSSAVIDLAAPVQGDVEGQTLMGSIYELSPRHMGWIPEDVRILGTDGPDDARRKNMIEGAGFGVFGALIEGATTLLRGKKGLRTATEYIPENEKAGSYFASNKPVQPVDAEDALNINASRREIDLDEIGNYNTTKEVMDGYNPEASVIFGKDRELYSPFESGVRGVDDMGIVGGLVDNSRIYNNIDSVYGRVRNPLTQGVMNFALDNPRGVSQVVSGLGDELASAGAFSFRTPTGKMISSKTMLNDVDDLAAKMLQMEPKALRSLLGEYASTKDGLAVLKGPAAKAAKTAIENALFELADINKIRAAALTDSAVAGQISDMAWGMRIYDGGESALRLQDQLLDRIEFLQTLRGMTAYGKNKLVRDRSTWSRLTGVSQMTPDEKYSRQIADKLTGKEVEVSEVIDLIQADSKQFVTSLRNLSKERPNFLAPMAQLYELTDGDGRSVSYLNNYLRNSTGTLTKAVIDGQPEIPSTIMQGFWATLFNSALSGVKTPLKAGVSNLYTWGIKPVTEIGGAYLSGDRSQLNRAFYAYGSAMDTITESFDYAKRMFVRSAQDPHIMRGRDEIVYKTDQQMKLFKATADAAEAEGNLGPAVVYDIMQNQKELAEHPWLRFGNRAMQFGDAWQTATNGQMVARMQAYDEITEFGAKEFNQMQADQVAAKVYAKMFDEKGIIRDPQTLNMTAKQTFSQDNPVSKGFQDIMQRIPGLKPFFMFTRSPINSLSYGASFQPVSAFTDKLRRFNKPFEEMPTAKIERLLAEEGVDLTKGLDPQAEYTRLRNEYKGRAAVGTSLVMMGVYGYLSGNITGRAGLYDKKKQEARVKAGSWKPMKAFGVDYSQIPAVSDWLSLTIDIMDNAFALDQADAGELMRVMGHIIGANITERTQLQNIEQFADVLQGNPASVQRWAVNTGFSATTLVGGMLGTMNQIMAPQLKAVEQRLDQLVLNRIPGKPGLPDDYDFIDGGQVGTVENPVLRLYNALSPFPYHAQPSDAKQYLIDVEFNSELGMSSRTDGVPYTKAELSEIKRLMGEDGQFKRDILRIRSRMPAAEFRSKYAEATRKGLNPDVNTLDGLHAQLVAAQERAKTKAESQLPELMQKKREEALSQRGTDAYLKSGDIESAERWVQTMQQRGLY